LVKLRKPHILNFRKLYRGRTWIQFS